MLYLSIAGIIFFSLVLIKAAQVLSENLDQFTHKTHIGGLFAASILVGLSTSLPEMFVGITSALNNAPNISLGNAIGSNIANMTIITGGAALIGGAITIRNNSYAKDLLHAFIAGMAPLYLLMDNVLSRVDALILVALYFYFNYSLLRKRNVERVKREESRLQEFIGYFHPQKTGKNLMFIFLAIAVILFSADMIVRSGMEIASGMNISVLLVGLFFVAIGTSLPEFAVMYEAIRKRDASLFMGNLLGSIVANATLIIGITALISPIEVRAFNDYFIATIAFLMIFFMFYWFIRTKEQINRSESVLLLIMYAVFTAIEFLR